jgi:hypothetical protein
MLSATKLMSVPVVLAVLIAASVTALAQGEGASKIKTPQGDVARELIGQVQNVPITQTSNQYGYLSSVNIPAVSDDEGLHGLSTPTGGIAFEVVGQVSNFPAGSGQPATSQQYGYLSLINGLTADQIFSTAPQNETTARFTFFTDAVTERVISNGRLRIVNRIGTTTIYLDETPDGDFSNRDTFRDGTAVVTMTYRQQVIVDTGEGISGVAGSGTFTVMNLLTVTAVQSFEIGGENYRLGKPRDQFRQFYSGAPTPTTPPNGVFAGYAVAIERAEPDKD